jgi:hypothetical protein
VACLLAAPRQRWHGYDPMPEVAPIEEFVALVDEDSHCCFFG